MQRHLKKVIPLIKILQEDKSRIQCQVLVLTKEEKELAEEYGIDYNLLDLYSKEAKQQDFDIGWALSPLINAIDTINPDLFIATEVNYILRNAVRYCKQKGVPNIIIQHGTPNKYSLHAFEPFEGDCFLAWGDYTRDILINNHVDPSRIVVTGGINFDQTLSIEADKSKIAQLLEIDCGKKWITFTTQGSGTGNIPTQEEIASALTETTNHMMKYNDYQLLFQVHPGQMIEDVKKIVDTVPEHTAKVIKYKDTEELIAASDGIITFFSTTALDAIILGKPLMLINLSEDIDFLPFVKMGASYGAYFKEDIGNQLDNLIFCSDNLKNGQKKAAFSINYMNDGRALERVMAICYNRLKL
jgi:hypothetical protein